MSAWILNEHESRPWRSPGTRPAGTSRSGRRTRDGGRSSREGRLFQRKPAFCLRGKKAGRIRAPRRRDRQRTGGHRDRHLRPQTRRSAWSRMAACSWNRSPREAAKTDLMGTLTAYALRHRAIVLVLLGALCFRRHTPPFSGCPSRPIPTSPTSRCRSLRSSRATRAEEVERLVTIPIENQMNGIPKRVSDALDLALRPFAGHDRFRRRCRRHLSSASRHSRRSRR